MVFQPSPGRFVLEQGLLKRRHDGLLIGVIHVGCSYWVFTIWIAILHTECYSRFRLGRFCAHEWPLNEVKNGGDARECRAYWQYN